MDQIRVGTPAYMAPEQTGGKSVTIQSALYALGLVLYEVFTGQRALLRCLDPEPSARPRTALSVAASLPGGDPLAAALAAGETPSPEMVARERAGRSRRPSRRAAPGDRRGHRAECWACSSVVAFQAMFNAMWCVFAIVGLERLSLVGLIVLVVFGAWAARTAVQVSHRGAEKAPPRRHAEGG